MASTPEFRVIKASVQLTLSEGFAPWVGLRSLIRAAQGGDTAELQGPPIIILRQETRQRISIQVRGMSVEDQGSDGPSTSLALTTAERIGAVTELPHLSTIRMDAIVIDPFELGFIDLVERLRRGFLTPNPLTTPATDIQIVLDEKVSEVRTNHVQVGPMLPDQLNTQFLAFARDDLPGQFAFYGLGRTVSIDGPAKWEDLRAEAAAHWDWATAMATQIGVMARG